GTQSFPGARPSPGEVVSAQGPAPLMRVRTELAHDPRFGPTRIATALDGTALLLAQLPGDPSGKPAIAAVRDLRSETSGTGVLVGAVTSENVDYIDSAIFPAWYVIALVLALTFIPLTTVFRSVTLAG